jgi:hypothetical protein
MKDKLSLDQANSLAKGAKMKAPGDAIVGKRKKLLPEDKATVKETVYFTPKEKAIIEKMRGRLSVSSFCVTTMTKTGIFEEAKNGQK